jgi:hypothetical protein
MRRCMSNGKEYVAPTPFLSPTEKIKDKSVSLLFECIAHNSRAVKDEEKYAFSAKTRDLSILLEKYTPKDARRELKEWYSQLDQQIKDIKESNMIQRDKEKDIINLRYKYALEVHEHNQRILMNSPIIEIDAEGELDISDEGIMNVVRGGKRTDDKRIVFKQ